jgi:hypothetical protein
MLENKILLAQYVTECDRQAEFAMWRGKKIHLPARQENNFMKFFFHLTIFSLAPRVGIFRTRHAGRGRC